jgi:hypothetical protein
VGLSVGRAVRRELEQKMMQFAAALRRLGLAQGDKVGGAAFDNIRNAVVDNSYDESCGSNGCLRRRQKLWQSAGLMRL